MSADCSIVPQTCYACCPFQGCELNGLANCLPAPNQCKGTDMGGTGECYTETLRDLMAPCCPRPPSDPPGYPASPAPPLPPPSPPASPAPPAPPPAPPSSPPPPEDAADAMCAAFPVERGDPRYTTWGLRLYCAGKTETQMQQCIIGQNIGACENLVCHPGMLCLDPRTAVFCPEGHYCKAGVNASQPCSSGWFGLQTPEERCPIAQSFEPPARESFVILLIVAVPLYIILEIAACLEKRMRAAHTAENTVRHMESDSYFNKLSATQRRKIPIDERVSPVRFMLAMALEKKGDKGDNILQRMLSITDTNSYDFLSSPSSRREEGGVVAIDLEAEHSRRAPPPPPPLAEMKKPKLEKKDTMALARAGGSDDHTRRKGRVLMKLEMLDVTFTIGKAKVLTDISTVMRNGELVALMGESGSGKTTLLNVIGGRAAYGHSTGHMKLNTRTFHPQRMSNLIGYVPQAHLVFKELTVYENLAYSAMLRLRRTDNTPHYRHELIESALDLLGLQPCRHFVCDPSIGERLSGGQMRRIGIGIELACDPPMMLLDEPTSALDAVNTRLVVAALKDLSKRGVLVLASLHQPRQTAYEMLDRLLLLRKGELIYGGLVVDAPRYFIQLGYNVPTTSNPADFFIEVAFGFETSDKKNFELPASFGLRYDKISDILVGLPELCATRAVRADMLGMLWRNWYKTSMRSVETVMRYLSRRSAGNRRFFTALLKNGAHAIARKRRASVAHGGVPAERRKSDPNALSQSLRSLFSAKVPEATAKHKKTKVRRDSLVRQTSTTQGSVDPRLLGVTPEEFEDWFMSKDGFNGSLRRELAKDIWKQAEARAEQEIKERRHRMGLFTTANAEVHWIGLQPSWAQLRDAIDGAPMPTSDHPNWFVHFYVCLIRYLLKLLRTRGRIYGLCFILVILGVICGVLHGAPPSRNDLLIYYMIFNTLFATICATACSATFGGDTAFFIHEAASGVQQTAEGLARIIADLLWLVLFAPTFILTLRTFAAIRAELYATWIMSTLAFSGLGYLFTLIAPNNANVLTATVVVLVCCLTNGFFGIKASMAHAILQVSPGFNSYLLLAFGACQAEPFDTTRIILMRFLRDSGMIPQDVAGVLAYETGEDPWRSNALRNLYLFGIVIRAISLFLFYFRSHFSIEGAIKHFWSRVGDVCWCCRDNAKRLEIRERLAQKTHLGDREYADENASKRRVKRAVEGAVEGVAGAMEGVAGALSPIGDGIGGVMDAITTPLSTQQTWLAQMVGSAEKGDEEAAEPVDSGPLSPIHETAVWLPSPG